jgi:hypothetical protein
MFNVLGTFILRTGACNNMAELLKFILKYSLENVSRWMMGGNKNL